MGLTGQRTPRSVRPADRSVFAPLKQRDACMRYVDGRFFRRVADSGFARADSGFALVAEKFGREIARRVETVIDKKLRHAQTRVRHDSERRMIRET